MSSSWFATPSALFAPLHLLDFDGDGAVPLPPTITHVVIEIGCNGHGLLWNNAIDAREFDGGPLPAGIASGVPIREQPHVLLVSFEPLLDKYASYLSLQKSQTSMPRKPTQGPDFKHDYKVLFCRATLREYTDRSGPCAANH